MLEVITPEGVLFVVCAIIAVRFVYWLSPNDLIGSVIAVGCFMAYQYNAFFKIVVVLIVILFFFFSSIEEKSNSSSSSSSTTISVTA